MIKVGSKVVMYGPSVGRYLGLDFLDFLTTVRYCTYLTYLYPVVDKCRYSRESGKWKVELSFCSLVCAGVGVGVCVWAGLGDRLGLDPWFLENPQS